MEMEVEFWEMKLDFLKWFSYQKKNLLKRRMYFKHLIGLAYLRLWYEFL